MPRRAPVFLTITIVPSMKRILLAISLFLLHTAAMAQSNIFIPIDNQDCVNCLSSVHYIGMIDSAAPPTIVFQKRYRRDSAALIKRLHLQPFRNQLAWSDSLYQQFRGRGMLNSSVSLYNAESGKILRTSFLQVAGNLRFLQALNRPADTITFDRSFFGGEPNFGNTGSYFYNFDGVSKELLVFNKADNRHLYTLSLNDSLVEVAFKLRFGSLWKEAYHKVQEYTSRWQTVDPQAYCSYYCSNDTVYLMAQHHYMIYPEEGASGIETSVFLSLSEYKDGALVRFSLVENYLDSLMKGKGGGIPRLNREGRAVQNKKAHYTLAREFLVYRGELYPMVSGGFSNGIPNHFLAKYKYDAPRRIPINSVRCTTGACQCNMIR